MLPLVDVAVQLPVRGTFRYALPAALGAAGVGSRVLVPFGARGVTGVIVRTGASPGAEEVKEVRDLLDDDLPPLAHELVELCMWIADYYEAPPGEVLRTALPPGTSQSDHDRLELGPRGRAVIEGSDGSAVPESIRRVLLAVASGRRPRLMPGERQALLATGMLAQARDRRGARVKVPMRRFVRLVRSPDDAERAKLARAPKRAAVLRSVEEHGGEVPATELDATAVRALAAAGLVQVVTRPLVPPEDDTPPDVPHTPTAEQAAALAAIDAATLGGEFQSFLLHGVTGSGKTEVYLQAIASVLGRGKGAVVLVPEIALTPQLASRFRARFGDQVVVLHSGLGNSERVLGWRRLATGEARIAVGARSAVFAPVRDVGIVVVDEEHDPSFKQEEGVRYHARDVALVRAQRAGAVCVLGSATPSLESYQRAVDGRMKLLELHGRARAQAMPTVELTDLRVFQAEPDTMLTAPLAAALDATIAAGDQAILFLNRRGFATFVVCVACGTSFRCPSCSVSLTYHRAGDGMRCHYCGHHGRVPDACPKCKVEGKIRRLGTGTERLEDALARRYPRARIGRLDRDSAQGGGLDEVLGKFARRELDVLVGTQMVTKGHDFPGVTLVGVLLADGALSLPDFRSSERTFQLLTQVAGRAGRGDRPGKVIVQAYAPDHHAVACAARHDYASFFAAESAARAELGYPPHGRLVAIRVDGMDEGETRAAATALAVRASRMAGGEGVTVLGPSEAPLRRLKGRTRWHMWLKSPDRVALRSFTRRLVADLSFPRDIRVTVDVDPMSAM